MSKILIIGGSSFLGFALMKELSKHEVIGTYHSNQKEGMIQLDMNDSLQLEKTLNEVNPEIVLLPAAESGVDAYETEPEISDSQIQSAQHVTDWCKKNEAKIVFFSTDFVFDGEKGMYTEKDIPNPINAYGKNKLEIENIVQQNENHLVLRISTLYGLPFTTPKFVNNAIKKLSNNEEITAVTDWKKCPTLTRDIALGVNQLLEKNQVGLFHMNGKTALTMFDVSIAITKEFNVSKDLVKPIKGADLELPAERPEDTSLDISKLEAIGIQMSSFEQGLKYIHENM